MFSVVYSEVLGGKNIRMLHMKSTSYELKYWSIPLNIQHVLCLCCLVCGNLQVVIMSFSHRGTFDMQSGKKKKI